MTFLLLGGAWPVPILDLDELTGKADLIVVGQVISIRELGRNVVSVDNHRVPVRVIMAELRADGILKGQVGTQSLQLRFFVPEMPIGWRGVEAKSYRLFFLKASGGSFELLSRYYPSVVAAPGVSVQGSTTIERVISQIGAVLAAPGTSTEQKQEAAYTLSRTKSPLATQALRAALQVKDPVVQLNVAAFLLERNDLSGLQIAEKALLDPAPNIPDHILHNLSYGISEGVKQGKAIPSLTRLLDAPNPKVRRASASALRHTASRLAIDPLLSALDDSDVEVRFYSVVGLAEITGQTDWRPNMDEFLKDQTRYVNHWKEWARSR